MKTLMNITMISAALMSGTVSAEHRWVETSFWRAPVATEMTLKLNDKERFSQQCAFFRKNFAQLSARADLFSKFRKPISPLVVELELKAWEKAEKEIELEKEVVVEDDKLPYFTQSRSVTGVVLDEATGLQIEAGEKSFTSAARKLNLADSAIHFSKDESGQFSVSFSGLDAACDLYEGNAVINMKAPAYMYLSSDETDKLTEFYNRKLFPSINDLFTAKENVSLRAMRFGVRAGRILADEFTNVSDKHLESMVTEMTRMFFDLKNFEATSRVIRRSDSHYAVISYDQESQPVTLKLEF